MSDESTKVRYAKVSYCLVGGVGMTCNAYFVQTESQYGQVAEVLVGSPWKGAPDPESDEFERLLSEQLRDVKVEHAILSNRSERYVSEDVVDTFYVQSPYGPAPWWAGWSRCPSASPTAKTMFFQEKTFPRDLLRLAKAKK